MFDFNRAQCEVEEREDVYLGPLRAQLAAEETEGVDLGPLRGAQLEVEEPPMEGPLVGPPVRGMGAPRDCSRATKSKFAPRLFSSGYSCPAVQHG